MIYILGAGVIADMIQVERRGAAYGLFYVGPLVGPVLGKKNTCNTVLTLLYRTHHWRYISSCFHGDEMIYSSSLGILCQYYGWKASFYFMVALGNTLDTVRNHNFF